MSVNLEVAKRPAAYPNLTLVEVPIPDSVDDPRAWAIHGCVALARAGDMETLGYDDLVSSAAEVRAELAHQKYERLVSIVALAEPSDVGQADKVLGHLKIELPTKDNTHQAEIELRVRADVRRRGIGTALVRKAIELCSAEGRTALIVFTEDTFEPAPEAPGALTPPTGAGVVDRDSRDAAFALKAGFSLEQAERYSVLRLPIADDVLARWRDEAQAKAGEEYRVVQWIGPCPDEWVDELAQLHVRMSTDMPSAGLELLEEDWDAERVREMENVSRQQEMELFTTVIEHVPSHTLAAFSVIEAPAPRPAALYQSDTLVTKEHRGRSLGLLAKAANLQLVQRERPQARRVHTWNAGENEHMLAINVRMGFARTSVCAAWQLKLGDRA